MDGVGFKPRDESCCSNRPQPHRGRTKGVEMPASETGIETPLSSTPGNGPKLSIELTATRISAIASVAKPSTTPLR